MKGLAALRADALAIFAAALKAADPAEAIRRHMQVAGDRLIAGGVTYDLRDMDRIYVVGAGKAGATMALAVEDLLGDRIAGGLVNTKYGHTASLRRVELNECGHPVPDAAGVEGARRIAEIAANAGERDLLLCVISGGGSALLPYPADGITLEDKQSTTRLLLECGADIHEINAVRKHISGIKGGRLAALAYPARVLSLILSDVIGNDLDVIASGATAPDSSTFADALAIVDRYRLRDRIPLSVRGRLEKGREETPKANHPAFARVQNLVVGSNDLALNAAASTARELGYDPNLFTTKNNLVLARASQRKYDLPVVGMTQIERAELLHTAALAAIKQGDIAIGRSLLEQAIETHPQHFEAAARSLRALGPG